MAHTSFNNKTAPNGISIAVYKVTTFFYNLAENIKIAKQQRETYKTLQSLTNRELNDIGISRGDIRAIAMDIWEDNNKRDAKPLVRSNPNLEGWS
jgi:uncharacterized protein YjiS (DUF1127 family)